jgi:hypothetical protein
MKIVHGLQEQQALLRGQQRLLLHPGVSKETSTGLSDEPELEVSMED